MRLPDLASGRASVREAMALRHWTWRRLALGIVETAPRASARAWRVFFMQERCAALLRESLRATPTVAGLEPDTTRLLDGAAGSEMQRVLGARVQLRLLATIAKHEGWQLIVLKSGVVVAEGGMVAMADVDVWAPPHVVPLLANRLDQLGFAPLSPLSGSYWHLSPRHAHASVQIEVHHVVSGFDEGRAVPLERAQPLAGHAPLLRLAPVDHVWTILRQASDKHPERRTRLRELLMLRAMTAAPDFPMSELLARIHANRQPRVHHEMLRAATSHDGGPANARLLLCLSRTPWLHDASTLGKLARSATMISVHGIAAERRRRRTLFRIGGTVRSAWRVFRAAVAYSLASAIAVAVTADSRWLFPTSAVPHKENA